MERQYNFKKGRTNQRSKSTAQESGKGGNSNNETNSNLGTNQLGKQSSVHIQPK